MDPNKHVIDANLAGFEQEVILKSKELPVLVDFWATWCGPCKSLGPLLEKLADEYAGGFLLAKVDVDQEQQLAGYFQVKSIPTVMLVKDGQIVDGFPGALPEAQLREFLQHHGVMPLAAAEPEPAQTEPVRAVDPHAELVRLRAAANAEPDKPVLKLDLALALLAAGNLAEAQALLDGLPADLGADDRAIRAHSRLSFAAQLAQAPPRESLEAALGADPGDLRARHLLGVHQLMAGESERALEQFLEMLRRDRKFQDDLPKKTLIEAFRLIEDPELVGQYRRRMASLLF